MLPNQLSQWFFDIPVVTRLYLTTSFLLTVSVTLNFLTYFQLYLNYKLVFNKFQIWRLFTNFFYFGQFSFNWFFNMFFIGSYCRMLEEGTFQGRTADFCWMLMFFSICLLFVGPFLHLPFLSSVLTFAIVYVWSRKSPEVQMAFLGLFSFRAPYLPFILIGMTSFVNSTFPYSHLVAMIIGHVYYFLDDVWPNQPASGGRRLLAAPEIIKRLFERHNAPPVHPHED